MAKNTVWNLQQHLWLWLIFLFCQYCLAGLLLSLYHAPNFVWIGNQVVTLHLAWASTAALALATVWLVGLVWHEVIFRSWLVNHPHLQAQDWAIAIMSFWCFGLICFFTLAFSARRMEFVGFTKIQTFWSLLTLAWMGLGVGSLASRFF